MSSPSLSKITLAVFLGLVGFSICQRTCRLVSRLPETIDYVKGMKKPETICGRVLEKIPHETCTDFPIRTANGRKVVRVSDDYNRALIQQGDSVEIRAINGILSGADSSIYIQDIREADVRIY